MSQRDVGLSQPRSKSLPCNSDGDVRPGPIIWSRVWWFILFGATVGAGFSILSPISHSKYRSVILPDSLYHSENDERKSLEKTVTWIVCRMFCVLFFLNQSNPREAMSQRDVSLSQPRSKSLPCNSDGDVRPGPIIWSRVWWFILFGATVGAGLDYLHTDGGCIVYPEGTTHSRGILTFAFLYGVVAVLHTIVVNDVLEAPMVTPPPYRHSTLAISVYAALYFVTAYWFTIVPAPLILVMCLVFAFICWCLFDGTWQGLTSSVGVAICGTVVESTLCSNGLMAYVMDDFIGVPMWLPCLYLAGSASYGAMVRRALLVEDHLEPIDNARSSTLYRRM